MTTVTNAQYPYSVNARSGNLWRRYLLEKISHSDRLLGSEDREMPRSFPANCSSSVFSHLCKQYICPKHLEHRYGNRCPISIIPFLWTKSDGVVEDIMYRFLGFSNTKSTTLSTARAFHHHLDNALITNSSERPIIERSNNRYFGNDLLGTCSLHFTCQQYKGSNVMITIICLKIVYH